MRVVPLTKSRWDDFVDLFTRRGPRGGASAVGAYPQTIAKRRDYMGSVTSYKRLGFKPGRQASVRTIMRLSRP